MKNKKNGIRRFSALKQWIRNHKKRSAILLSIMLVVAIGGTLLALAYKKPVHVANTPAPTNAAPPKPIVYYSPLTGEKVKSKSDLTIPVTAIMIENSPDARPQSGLKDAEVVYEAIAEGGVTRFMALYQQHKPKLIGPVRSVRPYFIDWVVPYNASVAHVGGSYKALKEIRNGKYRDIDQFFNANSYYRASDRYAPHNVYTTFKRLDALNKAKKYKSSVPKSFERTNESAVKEPTATKLSVKISGPLFDSSYTYDAKRNRYERSEGGEKHKDREKGTITPKVVVVLKVEESTVKQDTYRQKIQTTGSGSGVVFQNGTATKVTWHRKSRNDQYTFIDKNGKAVELVRGQTWITAIPKDQGSVSWK